MANNPQILIDVDDVVLHHVRHLKQYLSGTKFELVSSSKCADWGLFDKTLHKRVEQSLADKILEPAFHDFAHRQEPIEGVAAAVNELGSAFEVAFLTNVPKSIFEIRRARLLELGMDYPVIRNSGGKGRKISELQSKALQPLVFIDDSERQIRNAKRHSPHTYCIKAALIGSELSGSAGITMADSTAHSWVEVFEITVRTLQL